MKLEEALRKAVREFGISVLREKRLLYILSDLRAFDEYPAMRRVFEALVSGGFAKEISGLCPGGSRNGSIARASGLKESLVVRRHFKKEFADYAVDCVLFALGLISSVTEPSDHGYDPIEKSGAAGGSGDAERRSSVQERRGPGNEPGDAGYGRNAAVGGEKSGTAVLRAGTGVEKARGSAGSSVQGFHPSGDSGFVDNGNGASAARPRRIKWILAAVIIAVALLWGFRAWLSREESSPGSAGGAVVSAAGEAAGATESRSSSSGERVELAGDPAGGQRELEQGEKYFKGQGVSRDYAEALRWYRKAADLGNAAACGRIGVMYYTGDGVRQDYDEALRWLRKSAELGSPEAAGTVGWMYEHGTGVRENYAEAAKWYRIAAEKGHEPSRINLGYMYESGIGVQRDTAEAMKWYRLAAEQGSPYAKDRLRALGGR